MSINEEMDKEGVGHKYNGILFSHIKKEIMPSSEAWLDLETVILNEVIQRLISYDFAYMWKLKKNWAQRNLSTK